MLLALVALASLILAGCQPASAGSAAGGSSSSSVQSSPTPEPAVLSFAPAPGSSKVRPDAPVAVGITGGTISSVKVTSSDGKALKGKLDPAGGWRLTDALVAGTTYRVDAAGTSDSGRAVSGRSSFSTLKASRLVSTTLIPGDDWNVGVGMPVIVVFSSAVKNKKAAQAALTVSSTPAVEGAWRWFSATEVHWRPKAYWPSGTKVHVTAAMSNVELADGVWGKRTTTSSFTISRSQIITVDTVRHALTVRRGGSVVRTIPVTTGKAGFRTRNGIKVVMSRESQVRMDASTLGTDKNDPEYYNLLVNWALRLTYSGEFLHAAPWSVGSQGRANVSHGCTGMSTSNARWLYDNSVVGDVVVFTGSPRALEWGNGYTEWNKSFGDYASGT